MNKKEKTGWIGAEEITGGAIEIRDGYDGI
jgi:hypothetical protein